MSQFWECRFRGKFSRQNYPTLYHEVVSRQDLNKNSLIIGLCKSLWVFVLQDLLCKIHELFQYLHLFLMWFFFGGVGGSMTFKNKNNYSTDLIQYPLGTPPNSHKCRFIRIPYQICKNPGGDCYWAGGQPKISINSQTWIKHRILDLMSHIIGPKHGAKWPWPSSIDSCANKSWQGNQFVAVFSQASLMEYHEEPNPNPQKTREVWKMILTIQEPHFFDAGCRYLSCRPQLPWITLGCQARWKISW